MKMKLEPTRSTHDLLVLFLDYYKRKTVDSDFFGLCSNLQTFYCDDGAVNMREVIRLMSTINRYKPEITIYRPFWWERGDLDSRIAFLNGLIEKYKEVQDAE